jgi:hypothetical protein
MDAGERPPYYLALDPGLHTGWATWDESGLFITMGTVHTYDALHDLLADFPMTIKVVIVEDFKLFKHKARQQAGSRMPAPRAIGQIETFVRLWGASIVKQPSHIKSTAERLTGVSTKNLPHDQTHVLDAFNHGEYYLIGQGIKKLTADELRKSIN